MTQSVARLERAAGPVSRETFEQLLALQELFLKWAARMNLVAPSTLEQVWERHIIDSAQLLPLAPGASHWVDLGSGGGFPSLVVATLLAKSDGAHMDMVESNRKKGAFLRTAVQTLNLPALVHIGRIEDVAPTLRQPDVVTARALAPLPLLLDLAAPLFSTGTKALFHKGRDYRRELSESADHWSFDLLDHPSMVESDSVILEISNLQRRQA